MSAHRPSRARHIGPVSDAPQRGGWLFGRDPTGVLVATGLLLVVAAIALAPVWSVLHAQWTGARLYQHGYLVAGMAAWLAWRDLTQHGPVRIAPEWRFAVLLAAVMATLTVLELLFVNVPRVYFVPPLLVAAGGLVFGRAVAARIVWPAILLYGALPIWPAINTLLQTMTTKVVSQALAATNVTAFIEGNFVHLAAGSFEIAEECSGLKYVIVSFTLTLFYGLAFLPTWRRRGLLVSVAVVTAILCNWVRVYTVILAGYLTDMQHYLVAEEHIMFGWVLFVVFMIPVFLLARRLEADGNAAPHESGRFVIGAAVLPAAVAACVLISVPRIVVAAVDGIDAPADGPLLAAPSEGEPSSDWQPVFDNAREERATYGDDAARVEYYAARYPRQDAEHRVVTYRNSFVPASWLPLRRARVEVPVANGTLSVLEQEGYIRQRRRIVWGWYEVAAATATTRAEVMLLELKALLTGRRDASAVAVSTACDLDCKDARARLTALLNEHPELYPSGL